MKPAIFKSTVISFVIFLTVPFTMLAQDAKDKKESSSDRIRAMVSEQRYIFKAETASPLAGSIRQLSGGYELRVTKDTITAYLPYFGRAYTAPINPGEGGIRFTSTRFNYTVTERKKGGWEIVLKPLDVQDTRQLNLFISENGYGILQVTSTNRQAISFNGSVADLKEKKII